MKRLSTLMLAAATLLLATGAWAQAPETMQGTVVRVDQVERIVVLEDGRMVRVIETSEIVINDKPATLMALEPGTVVVIRGGQPVATVVVPDSSAALVRQEAPAQTTIIQVGAGQPWCEGAWDPARGTNFGPCAAAK
ncbi:MAG: hypothetical protein ACREJV_00930 [Candidatus Rokuibacteriota bacterium]